MTVNASLKTNYFIPQVASIPHILQEKNCVVSAHTGCGKTLAYLIPLVQMVLKHTLYEKGGSTPLNSPRALILTPSRELTYQIYVSAFINSGCISWYF